ncbi:hypothetical protein ACFFRR_004433 [Megaselia abdita]
MKIFLVLSALLIQSTYSYYCGENNKGMYIRYFTPHYRVCINPDESETFFAYHRIDPREDKQSDCRRLGTWKTEIYEDVGNAYNKDDQFKTFENIGFPNMRDEKEMFFIHFHLAPSCDFKTRVAMDRTQHIENCVPGFQKVNNGNWLFIEERVRSTIQNKVEIITGQFGQLIMTPRNNNNVAIGPSVKMSLKNTAESKPKAQKQLPRKPRYDNIKVPEFFYKIVRDTVTMEAYVIITSNDPFMKEMDMTKRMCQNDICSANKVLKVYAKGYTYCCPFQEFTENLKNSVYKVDFSCTGINVGNTQDSNDLPF